MQNLKEYLFTEVFKFERGMRLTKEEQTYGEIAYISSTKNNNGIDNYISPPPFMKIYENKLTLSNSGSVGYCFYHDYPFVASDHVTVISPKDVTVELNLNLAMYLKVVLEKMRPKYNFAREINNERLSKEIVKLPSKKDGNPDWQAMENHIIKVAKNVKYDKREIFRKIRSRRTKISTQGWREFRLTDIFKLKKSRPIHARELEFVDSGELPYITRTDFNNSTEMLVRTQDIPSNFINIGNCISIGGESRKSFYQSEDFITGNNITLLYSSKLNIYNGLFLTAVLNLSIKLKYSYGRGATKEKLSLLDIKLPINSKNQPDWEFMEDYIKSLPYSASL